MEISQIDKNFEIIKTKTNGKLIKVPSNDVSLFGLFFDSEKGFYRLPFEVAEKLNSGIQYLHMDTAGGRVAFTTNSKNLAIHVTYESLDIMHHMNLVSQGGFSLCEFINGKETHIHTFSFSKDDVKGYSSSAPERRGNKNRNYLLYFPLYNRVKTLYIEIDNKSDIKPFNPYQNIKPIIYYGSSITQGGCASRSDHSYQGFIGKWLNVDYKNLGFSGSCKGEIEMAKYITNQECSVFVMDYDHNAPNPEHLEETHERFFLEFRKKQPKTPVIFISAPSYHYDSKGLIKRLKIIKNTYLNAINKGDKNVYFLDGSKLYPRSLRYDCAVDGTHPTDLGFYFIALKLYKILKIIYSK